jgi:hypothetical protein
MLNTILSMWVKNVYTRRTHGSVTGVLLSPTHSNTITTHTSDDVQLPVTHPNVLFFTTYLSTSKIASLPLLFTSFPYYPQSLLLEPLKKI